MNSLLIFCLAKNIFANQMLVIYSRFESHALRNKSKATLFNKIEIIKKQL